MFVTGPELYILLGATALFLLIASSKLTIEELISLVGLCKKLKATWKSEYSLKSGKLEVRDEENQRSNLLS